MIYTNAAPEKDTPFFQKEIDRVRSNPENETYKNIEKAITEHINNHQELPIGITIGLQNMALNASFVKDLVSVYNKYEKQITDQNRTELNLYTNPNIFYTKIPENNASIKYCNLNDAVTTSILNLLAKFQQQNEDMLIYYKPPKSDKAIADFELSKSENYSQTFPEYKLLTKYPLNKKLSFEFNYHFIVKNLVDKDILNPDFKYNWQESNNIIDNIPKDMKRFKETFNPDQEKRIGANPETNSQKPARRMIDNKISKRK
jgi:hypothetical protein